MTKTLTEYEKFCRDGYYVAPKILDETQLEQINAALALPIKNLCRNSGLPVPEDGNRDSLHKSMIALKKHDQNQYLNAIKISQNLPEILGIPAIQKVRDALAVAGLDQPVVSLKPFPVMVSDALHIEGGYNLRPLHQEWPVMQGSSDGVICWIALHDITSDHNALHLLPGSHIQGLREYHRTKCGTGIIPEQLPGTEPLRMEIKAGDAVIFSCFTAHGSSPTGGDLRCAVTIRFNNLAAADFIDRGYPDPSRVEIERQPENMHKPTSILRAR